MISRRLISAAGLLCIISLCAIFSKHPRRINWNQVIWGVILQLAFALLILRWELGKSIMACISDKIQRFLQFTDVGSEFVFGHLSHQKPFLTKRLVDNELAYNITRAINDVKAMSSVIVFRSLPVIYFFCFVVNILFYFGAIQWITTKLGYVLW
jgi:pyrimidine nucleoside transport protein